MTSLQILLASVRHTAALCPDAVTKSKLNAHVLQFAQEKEKADGVEY